MQSSNNTIWLAIYSQRRQLFDKKYNIDYNSFIKEYSKIFIANLYREGFTLFFFNHIDLSIDDTLEALDAISKLVNSDLIILCLSLIK